jgi:NAD(P)-dependent dehydrogenase (short-subunit alcohol dehydrogenase family)
MRHSIGHNFSETMKRRATMELGLAGKKVIMNGGSHGIGLETLKLFTAEGANIAFFSRDQGRVDAALAAVAGNPGKAHGEALDMNDNAEGYRAWLSRAVETLGGCDIFIHTASASGMGATQDWHKCFEIDVMGGVAGIEVLEGALEASGNGSVIFMSSTAAVETFIMPQAFNAIKAALITYASQLSQSLAAKGIRVNTVTPGPIEYKTGNWEAIKAAMPDFYNGTVAQMPMGRLGAPEEVARAIVFLASPASSYTTGTNLVVDGAYTKRVQF